MIVDNSSKFNSLRQEYNTFTYERFDYKLSADKISIKYTFNLSDKFVFEPELILFAGAHNHEFPDKKILDNLIFNIGMVELISYWKAACPPKVIIKPFLLDPGQVKFWEKLYYNGLGEFLYVNSIEIGPEDLMRIECDSEKTTSSGSLVPDEGKVIVPVGGGKDSIVSLEILKSNVNVIPFIINPRKASSGTVKTAGFEISEAITVERSIHPVLLKLNDLGFLNGHTPFSALIAFISLLAAATNNAKYIALSNESSANEPTVSDGPNHQYSKSITFERDFRDYVNRFISPDIIYFSFLRPLEELQIARTFSGFPQYFSVFKSCNVGSKADIWCGQCPKCLFTAIILSPFISREQIREIFGYEILDNKKLSPMLDSLAGMEPVKPFECVGTINEVNTALVMTIKKYGRDLPALLSYYASSPYFMQYENLASRKEIIMNEEHFLGKTFLEYLIAGIDDERRI